MDPATRGLAISNSEKIREEHNKFSHPEPFIFTKTKAKDGDDVLTVEQDKKYNYDALFEDMDRFFNSFFKIW